LKFLLSLTFTYLFLTSPLYASKASIEKIAKKFNLYPGSRAVIQWERIFSTPRHLKRYKLDTLPSIQREELKCYLINHAADSEQPIVPGL